MNVAMNMGEYRLPLHEFQNGATAYVAIPAKIESAVGRCMRDQYGRFIN